MKKTQEQILDRINAIKNDDVFGFETPNLIHYLTYKNAKQYLKESVTKEEWGKHEVKSPVDEIKDYMSFAWEKANDCRGISAGRSLCHMRAWLWLDGQDQFLRNNDIMSYEYYGKDHLVKICELYDIDHDVYDDEIRTNNDSIYNY